MANRTVSVKLVAEVGQYVAGMSKASAATMRLGADAADSGKKAEGGFGLAGKGALIAGGAVVAGLGMAISKSMAFESAMSGAAAATQVTGGALQDLRDAAMRAGADTQYSATEAAQAITEMGKAGVSTADILNGGLDGALALAAAGQLEVATAAEIASVAMTQFKLTGDQLPHVADLLAAGAGKAMGSVEDLGMALNQAGLVASASGLNIEETTGVLAAFASAGLVGSDAGTSLKTMLQKLQAPSKEAAGLMSDLGINMYDANGNFAGMDSLAGQLKGSMAKLTPATRDAAMATIFGSDAVRAANVLYAQGAEGIQDWTAKVNDAGYAQKQAAALTDNLAGDLERLGGSFDTLLITLGSGTQGPLRELVQALGGIVDGATWLIGAFDSIPGPVLAAVAALAGVKLLGGPLNSMMDILAPKITGVATGFGMAVTSVGGFKGAMSSIAGSFTPLNIGIGSAVALLPAFIELIKGLTGNSASAAAGQKALADALRATSGVVDESSRAAAKQQIIAEGLVKTLNAAGVSSKDAIDGLLGNAAAQERVTSALEDYIAKGVASGDMFGKQVTGANEAQDKYLQLAEALGMSKEETEFFGAAVQATGGALEGTNGAMEQASTAVRDFAGEASAADAAISALQAALDELSGKTVTMFEAESQLGAAIHAAKGALENKTGAVLNADGALDAYSESGRAAGDVLLGIRDKGNQLIATMKQQGATAADVSAADARLRGSFIQTAMAMGIEEGRANALADQILGIPSERHTRVTADTSQAAAAVSNLAGLIANLKDKTISILARATMVDLNGSASGSGRPGLATGGGIVNGRVQHFDIGGAVRGAGGPTADRVPAMLSNGEHVWTSAEVNAAGGQAAVAAMRRAVMSGREFSGGPSAGGGGGDIRGLATQIASILASRPTVGSITTQRNETGFELAEALSFLARTRG